MGKRTRRRRLRSLEQQLSVGSQDSALLGVEDSISGDDESAKLNEFGSELVDCV